jgi:CheY-like chemotaxis protein
MSEHKRILDVGQCTADHTAIRALFEKQFSAVVERCTDTPQALEMLSERPFDLVLVNRIIDATTEEGLDLIKRMKESPFLRDVPVMLISNFESAQVDAVELGAVQGFGKADLESPDTCALVDSCLYQAT